MVVDEDHYVHGVFYNVGTHTFSRKSIGTRYLFVALRTFIDPANPQDVNEGHALQDATTVKQPGWPGKLELPGWDQASQKKLRVALPTLNETLRPESQRRVCHRAVRGL